MMLAVSWSIKNRFFPSASRLVKFLTPFRVLTSPFINSTKLSAIANVLVSLRVAVPSKATNDAQTDNSSFQP